MDCEICGLKPAFTNVRIDGVIMNVCHDCESTGTAVDKPKQAARQIIVSRPSAEEIVVQDYAKLIQQARQKTNLKQEELAVKLNEKVPVMQAAENGKRLDIKLAKKLEKFFGIKLTEIV